MEKKIDRPLVRICRTTDNGEFDFHWYETMMGKQGQMIKLLEERLKTVKETLEIVKLTNNTLASHKNVLKEQLDKIEDKVIVFQPWNIGKKKKKNVED